MTQARTPASLARLQAWAAGLVAVVSLAGCNNSPDVSFRLDTSPPLAVSVSADRVELPVGIAIGVVASVSNTDDTDGQESFVDLVSSNPSVVGVAPALAEGVFVIYGVAPGSALISVVVNEEKEQDIPVVVNQPVVADAN